MATGGDDGYLYFINGDFIDKINLQKRIRSLAFSSNLSSLLIGTFEGSIFLVNTTTKTIQTFYEPVESGSPIKSIVAGNDGKFLALADKNIFLFSESGNLIYKLDSEEKITAGIGLNTDGKFLIATIEGLYLITEGKWNRIDNAQLALNYPISAMALLSNQLALGFKNGKINIFELRSLLNGEKPIQPVQEFIDHQTEITTLRFSKNKILYSSGLDKKIHAYDLDLSSENIAGYLIKMEEGKNWIWDIQVSENDEVIAVDESGALYFWVNNPTIQIQRLNAYLNQDQNSRRIN
jgi:WD40 repeat protein